MLFISLGVVLIALILIFKFFHKQIVAGLARLAMAAMQRREKFILLTKDEKEELLSALGEVNQVLGKMRRPPSNIMDELVELTRKYYAYAIDVAFTADSDEVFRELAAKVKRQSLQKSLVSFFSLMRGFEHTGEGIAYDSCNLAMEELRLFILLTSETTDEDLVHEADEKVVDGSVLERFDALFFNLLLTLQFGERVASREQYMKLLAIYEQMPMQLQSKMNDRLLRAYHLTKYMLSLR
jgi:hypothetical protein